MSSASVSLPALSANSLYHFTNSFDNLLSILKEEFRPRFCLEDVSLLFAGMPSAGKQEWAVPMVCFCDLPLSQTSFHLSVYGDYGIGLTKDWGKKNGIAPVLYSYPESILSAKLSAMIRAATGTHEEPSDPLNDFYDLMCFIKPYEGDLWREERVIPNLRFYNEREWRFVPQLPAGDEYRFGLTNAEFRNEKRRKAANRAISERSRISFEPNDIKYLIVRREDEIVPLIKEVETIKGKYSYDDVRLLFSRLISAEQIRSDF